jgi:hypothetical protein
MKSSLGHGVSPYIRVVLIIAIATVFAAGVISPSREVRGFTCFATDNDCNGITKDHMNVYNSTNGDDTIWVETAHMDFSGLCSGCSCGAGYFQPHVTNVTRESDSTSVGFTTYVDAENTEHVELNSPDSATYTVCFDIKGYEKLNGNLSVKLYSHLTGISFSSGGPFAQNCANNTTACPF